MIVDLVATQPHYLTHLAPVWHALSPHERGTIRIPVELTALAERNDVAGTSRPEPSSERVILAAGWSDLVGPPRYRHRTLLEHGAGQEYIDAPPPYVNGRGRKQRVDLALVPHEPSMSTCDYEVVGSPFLDELRKIHEPPLPRVFDACGSFHWECDVVTETRSGFRWFRDAFTSEQFVVHGHPRIADQVKRWASTRSCSYADSMVTAMFASRVWCVDNSSSMYFAAALDRPIVVMNPPVYRREVHHGMRFWDHADVGLQADDVDELFAAVDACLEYPGHLRERRAEITREVFAYDDGSSARRCVEAMRRLS